MIDAFMVLHFICLLLPVLATEPLTYIPVDRDRDRSHTYHIIYTIHTIHIYILYIFIFIQTAD